MVPNPMPPLPIDACLEELATALRDHHVAVLQAPTGTGKTTRVPLALLQNGLADQGQIWVLQPRRVAARATAGTMAQLLGEPIGRTVGYQIRFDRKAGPETKIMVVTEGILSRRLLQDPLLEGISCVILDEFHERSLHTDLSLAFLRELRTIREDLKFLIMSATLDPQPLVTFLDGCPFVSVEAPVHPLNIVYDQDRPLRELPAMVSNALKTLFRSDWDDGGDVLVFLPGAPEIGRVMRHLQHEAFPATIFPLHGGLSTEAQDAALAQDDMRRIILATNIAETSLTLPGVRSVIDSGYRKMALYDGGKGMDRLDLVRISQASATQRAGRAGRVGPGRVIRLWSEQRQHLLAPHDLPEIEYSDLSSFLLQILDFHGPQLETFSFFQEPPKAALDHAKALLSALGALTPEKRLSELGKKLCRLPVHPRMGTILAKSAALGWLQAGAEWCALLSERTPVATEQNFADLWQQFRDWERHNRTSASGLRFFPKARKAAKQLQRLGKQWRTEGENRSAQNHALVVSLLAGFSDRLCQRRQPGQGVMVGGRGVEFQSESLAQHQTLFLALDLRESGLKRTAAKVSLLLPVPLDIALSELDIDLEETYRFDEATQSVFALETWSYQDLVLQEKPLNKPDRQAIGIALGQAASEHFEKIYQPDERARSFVFRLRLANQYLSEESWPDVSEAGLKALLTDACFGKRKLSELKKLDWQQLLMNQMSWQQRALLDETLPERLEVPSGSQVKIDYQQAFEATGLPVLAVRLQECFGMNQSPTLARGRLPVLLHLLAPNMRPAQVTQDIVNFWNTTYQEVRKELRQRYPKHAWPENPWEAKAIRGVPRRK